MDAVGDAGVDVREHATIRKRLGPCIDIELIAAVGVGELMLRESNEDTHIVAGCVWFNPRKPPEAPVSVLNDRINENKRA